MPAAAGSTVELATALNTRLASLRLERLLPEEAGPGTPVPVETVALGDLLEVTEINGPAAPPGTPGAGGNAADVVVAYLRTVDEGRWEGVRFFEGITGACDLATILE